MLRVRPELAHVGKFGGSQFLVNRNPHLCITPDGGEFVWAFIFALSAPQTTGW
jgi:hypothetical protein